METKDLNSIGLAYLQMVEKKNTEAKKNHAKTLDKVDPEELEGDHEDRDDKDIDNDGDVDSSDEYLHKKRKAVKKAIKKDDGDDQEKFKAYDGDDKNDQEGTKVSEDAKYPHMMYDPKTGKGYKAEKEEDHLRMKKMGYTHDKPEEIDEATDLQEIQLDEAATMQMKKTADELNAYAKKSGGIDKGDFMKVARMLSTGKAGMPLVKFVNDLDTEPREKIITVMAKHMGQKTAEKMFNVGIREEATLMKTANESVNVDDVLALIDQGYTLDQAEAMVAEASCGTVNASRKQPKAGDNDRNMANNQRSIPAKGVGTAPVRPGTKAQQKVFDKADKTAKKKDKVSVAKAPWESVEVDEGYGSMVSPKDRARIKARVDANMDKLSAGQKKIAKQTPPRHKITRDDLEHLRTQGHANSPKKESVMDRVSNMVEDIRADIQEKKEINEGPGDINNPMKGMTGRFQGSGPAEPMRVKTMSKKREKELRDAGKLSNSANNASHYAGEAVQEAAKPTGIHHSTPVTAAQANDEQAADRWTDKAGRNTMTEKEFVDMHTIHPDVLPEFDGNVAAKKTAEAIKNAPKAAAKTPNTPTSKGDQKIMPDPTPYGGPAVKTESYMDKYAKYIRGEI